MKPKERLAPRTQETIRKHGRYGAFTVDLRLNGYNVDLGISTCVDTTSQAMECSEAIAVAICGVLGLELKTSQHNARPATASNEHSDAGRNWAEPGTLAANLLNAMQRWIVDKANDRETQAAMASNFDALRCHQAAREALNELAHQLDRVSLKPIEVDGRWHLAPQFLA
jgi:hypothetical protein